MKRLIGFLLFSAATFLFTTCSEPIDFVNEVETEVKIANDLFLEVVEVISPAENAVNVNPSSQIVVQFDKNVNLTSVSDSTIKITNVTDNIDVTIQNPSFSSANKQLTFEPVEPAAVGYFRNEHNYSVELIGLRGTDGSELQNSYTWSFRTGTAPAGTIVVTDRGLTDPESAFNGYTNERTVTVNIDSFNAEATRYYASINPTDFNDLGSVSLSWISTGTASNLLLFDQDGIQEVYAVFTNSVGDKFSRIIQESIILDRVPPSTPNVYNVASDPTTDTTPAFSWTSDGSSGTYYEYYVRTYLNGSGTYSDSSHVTTSLTTASPYISLSGIDRVRAYLFVRAHDYAGNSPSIWDSDSVIVSKFLPYNTQTGVRRYTTFVWPAQRGREYALQSYSVKTGWVTVKSKLTVGTYTLTKSDGALPANETFTWRVADTTGTIYYYSDTLTFETGAVY